jgi:CheY-like chemotaxis protein
MYFRQIFANILSNAVKYNKIYGKITLRVDMVSRTEDDVVYRFSVSDTGIGMSEEFQKHIFETFTQEDTGARTVYRGTGLGMAIAKKLVDALGGTIKIKSKKNVGSTFILVLPFAIDKDYENASVQSEPETPNVEGMHVLLVEDNELNLEIARYLLEEAGVQVIAAKNGQEALDIFEQSGEQEIDLILMDIMMPVMDGLEATRRIRTCTHPRGATVPIIAISANAFADDIQKAKNAGMNEHLAKPFEMEKVLRAISRYHKM